MQPLTHVTHSPRNYRMGSPVLRHVWTEWNSYKTSYFIQDPTSRGRGVVQSYYFYAVFCGVLRLGRVTVSGIYDQSTKQAFDLLN